jgi:hypothetical protein
MKTPSELTREQLEGIAAAIRDILWRDPRTGGFDPEKEWCSDTIEWVSGVMEDAGLKPGAVPTADRAAADPDAATPSPQEACGALIATIEATGGCVRDQRGSLAPAGDPDWIDLADAYLAACAALRRTPLVEEPEEGEDGTDAMTDSPATMTTRERR